MTLQQAKNALVASLFELSNAATSAATATVEFYKQAGLDGAEVAGSQLSDLSASIASAVESVTSTLPAAANATVTPRKRVTKKKVDFEGDANGSAGDQKVASTTAQEPATPSKLQTSKTASKPKANIAVEISSNGTSSETTSEDKLESVENIAAEKPAKVEKPKKKRAEKDPNAPKKPLTSYLRFNLQIRDSLRKARVESGQPTFQATELNQIIADKWANLTNEDKARLQQEYDTDFEEYKKALEEYKLKKQLEAPVTDTATTTEAPGTSEATKATTSAKSTPAKVTKVQTDSKAEEKADDSKTSVASPTKDEAKADKKKKTKVSSQDLAASVSSDVVASEDAASKKSKKRKEKDSDDKKLKKKKSE